MPRKDTPENRQKIKEYHKQWYEKNKKSVITRTKHNTIEKIKWYQKYKVSRGCKLCGENHIATLDFHHRDPANKKYTIHDAVIKHNIGWTKLKIEVEKCDILCVNCHKKLHYNQRRGATDA